MDEKIRARFYQAENVNDTDATLFDCLHRLWNHEHRTRYEEIFGGIRVRMERFESDSAIVGQGFVDGEFVRQQTENIPPIAAQDEPLEGNNSPLGHRCAFRYHAATGVLLLESRQSGVTPIRVDGLVKVKLNPHKGFFLAPVITEAALEKLRNGSARRVNFRVARPADMQSLEGDAREIEENLSRFANNFGGLTVEVSVGFPRGHNDRSLVQEPIRQAIRWATGNRDHVEKFSVTIAEEVEPIDIFSEQIKVVETLDLDNLDVDANYEVRRNMLSRAFNSYLPVIERIYAG